VAALDVCWGQVPERGGELEVRIKHGGGGLGLGVFYRARVVWRCGGGDVVWWLTKKI
jgi:hypothetical protein